MMLNDKDKQNDKILPGPCDYEIKFPLFDPDYIIKNNYHLLQFNLEKIALENKREYKNKK